MADRSVENASTAAGKYCPLCGSKLDDASHVVKAVRRRMIFAGLLMVFGSVLSGCSSWLFSISSVMGNVVLGAGFAMSVVFALLMFDASATLSRLRR